MLTQALDYMTANGPDVSPALNESQRSALYAELASGAESGMSFSILLRGTSDCYGVRLGLYSQMVRGCPTR